jgi:hypothetical protein
LARFIASSNVTTMGAESDVVGMFTWPLAIALANAPINRAATSKRRGFSTISVVPFWASDSEILLNQLRDDLMRNILQVLREI